MDDDKKRGGLKIAKAWQLWRVSGLDGHKIRIIAEADTQEELWRKHKRRADWHYKTYHNWRPSMVEAAEMAQRQLTIGNPKLNFAWVGVFRLRLQL